MEAREQPGAWLCPTELDRQRVLDMSPRVRRARTIGSAAVGVATLLLAPLLSWWLVGLFFLSALNLATLDRRMARSPRPERVVAGSLLWTELLIAGAAALSGGPRLPLLFWLAIPVGMASARFRGAVVTVATGIGALFVLGVSLVDPAGLADDPTLAIAALILLINVAAKSGANTREPSSARDSMAFVRE